MTHDDKAEVFNKLATAIDSFAWVAANTLKEKFGVVDDEEEYKKIESEVVDYVESDEFKNKVKATELEILTEIATVAQAATEALQNGND